MTLPENASLKRISISNYCIAFLFLVLYFLLSFHYRLASDDFYYLSLYKKFGAWNGMVFQYEQWSGRWAAHFLACLFLKFHANFFLLPYISILTLVLLYFSLQKIIKKLLPLFHFDLPEVNLNSLTFVLVTSFFFSTYSIGETWFWYIIILTYLWSIVAFLILLNYIFSESNNSINYSLIILTSAFIGGASESYALLFLFFLSLTFLYRWKRQKNKITERTTLRLLIAIVVLTISFSISILAPGTSIRYSLLPHPPLIEKFWIIVKAIIKYFVRFLPEKFIYLFIFSMPWFFFGSFNKGSGYTKIKAGITMINISLLFFITLIILFIPTTFIMSETGPDRALSIVSLITTVYFAILFFLFGTMFNPNSLWWKRTQIIFSLAAISFLILTILNQYPIIRNFTKAYNERMKDLDKAKTEKYNGVLELNKLPSSGYLYWAELSQDTSYFVNKHLKEGLELPFSVTIKE